MRCGDRRGRGSAPADVQPLDRRKTPRVAVAEALLHLAAEATRGEVTVLTRLRGLLVHTSRIDRHILDHELRLGEPLRTTVLQLVGPVLEL